MSVEAQTGAREEGGAADEGRRASAGREPAFLRRLPPGCRALWVVDVREPGRIAVFARARDGSCWGGCVLRSDALDPETALAAALAAVGGRVERIAVLIEAREGVFEAAIGDASDADGIEAALRHEGIDGWSEAMAFAVRPAEGELHWVAPVAERRLGRWIEAAEALGAGPPGFALDVFALLGRCAPGEARFAPSGGAGWLVARPARGRPLLRRLEAGAAESGIEAALAPLGIEPARLRRLGEEDAGPEAAGGGQRPAALELAATVAEGGDAEAPVRWYGRSLERAHRRAVRLAALRSVGAGLLVAGLGLWLAAAWVGLPARRGLVQLGERRGAAQRAIAAVRLLERRSQAVQRAIDEIARLRPPWPPLAQPLVRLARAVEPGTGWEVVGALGRELQWVLVADRERGRAALDRLRSAIERDPAFANVAWEPAERVGADGSWRQRVRARRVVGGEPGGR